MKKILQIRAKKRNPRQIKSNVNYETRQRHETNETCRKQRKMKKIWKNSQQEVIYIRSLIKAFYLMTLT